MVSFNPKADIPDLAGKVIVVTGGNTGIGYETCKVLLEKNAKVYLGARSEDKATKALATLKESTGKDAIWLKLNLSDLTTIKNTLEEFKSKEEKLDVLILNAGVMVTPLTDLTTQGYDMQWGTNVIGHYLLQKSLLPLLSKSKASTNVPARVVWLSSDGHKLGPGSTGLLWETMKGGDARDKWIKSSNQTKAPWSLYGQSKMGNVLCANHLARTHGDGGKGDVIGVAVHPGVIVGTDLQRTTPAWQTWIMKWFSGTNEQGAYTSLFASVGSPAELVNGAYCVPWGKVGKADKRGLDLKVQDELHEWLEKEVAAYAV